MTKPILKLKIYSVKDKLPKLQKLKGGSRIRSSRELILYWEWVNSSFKDEAPRLGHYIQHTELPGEPPIFQIQGISGSTRVIAWGYIKKLPL